MKIYWVQICSTVNTNNSNNNKKMNECLENFFQPTCLNNPTQFFPNLQVYRGLQMVTNRIRNVYIVRNTYPHRKF